MTRLGELLYNAKGLTKRDKTCGGGRELGMPEITVGKDESFDSALRRFKRECQRSGVLKDSRKHQYYESPSEKRKRKSEAARARKKRGR